VPKKEPAGPEVKYSIQMMLAMRTFCTTKPDGFDADDEISLEVPDEILQERLRAAVAKMADKGQKRAAAAKKAAEQPLRNKQGQIIEIKPLEHSATRWVPMKELTETDALIHKKARGLLNKLTPEKFAVLVPQFLELGVSTSNLCRGLCTTIFEKACQEHGFCGVYAELCRTLSSSLPKFEGEEADVTLVSILTTLCLHELDQPAATVPETLTEPEEIALAAKRIRTREIGMFRFLGEMYNKGLVPLTVVKPTLARLLEGVVAIDEQLTESLCRLLDVSGPNIEKEDADTMADIVKTMTTATSAEVIPARVKFMLLDTLELQKNRWRVRRAGAPVVAPRKLDHAAAEAARQHSAETKKAKDDARPRKPTNRTPTPRTPVRDGEWAQAGQPRRPANSNAQRGLGFSSSSAGAPKSWRSAPAPAASSAAPPSRFGVLDDEGEPAAAASSSDERASDATHSSELGESPLSVANTTARQTSQEVSSEEEEWSDAPLADEKAVREALVELRRNSLEDEDLLDEDQQDIVERKVVGILRELFNSHDTAEAVLCLKELEAPANIKGSVVVQQSLLAALDGTDKHRELVEALLTSAHGEGTLVAADMAHGLAGVLVQLDDLAIDVPLAPHHLEALAGAAVGKGLVLLPDVLSATAALGVEPRAGFMDGVLAASVAVA